MELILDTNAVSAAADESAALAAILKSAGCLALPVIVLGEYRYGIGQSRYRARYERWLNALIADCRVLEISEETTHHYADVVHALRQMGRPIPTNDLWIAALCRQYGWSLLSRDRHFDAVPGIRRITW
jgi:tRNA(fMet)-specific endonuclease VapC